MSQSNIHKFPRFTSGSGIKNTKSNIIFTKPLVTFKNSSIQGLLNEKVRRMRIIRENPIKGFPFREFS